MNQPATIPDDAQLLRRLAQRDRVALAHLYDRFAGVLYSTALRILNDPQDAAAVLQEVFLQIWDNAAAYDPAQGRPFTWALALARSKAIDRLRALQRRYRFLEEIAQEETAAPPRVLRDGEVFTREQTAAIRAAVATLPLEQRQAIEMAFLGGLNQEEIAAELRQPPATIKGRIRRGLLTLRASLKGIVC
jgi:RNA polymerase sigma-70 factor (ECF subfamily)